METDFLIIGSGISGLNFALKAAKKGKVTLITKKKLIDSNTNYAQGGIAAVLSKTDNAKKHITDTLKAGHYHNKKRAVKFMVKKSTESIYRLVDLGVQFEKEKGKLKLTKEGGHSQRRIAYVGDHTGKEIENTLVERVKEHPNISIFENAFALDLIIKKKTCYGSQIIQNNKIKNIYAHQTIIATGGVGQLYKKTTNDKIATGDGLAMAHRAGCKLKDLEFIQFHPTALDENTFPRFLISEALRGEGAKLVNEKGQRFTDELAPRDQVARAIYKQKKVYLDATHLTKKFLRKRFPKIYEQLEKHNYDLSKDKIPVTPAAHYICGGIKTNLRGRTSLKNLYAFGEVTYTGVHGANRLASNSLLEALVFSSQIINNLESEKTLKKPTPSKEKISRKKTPEIQKELQEIMWNYAGIIRNTKKIEKEAIPKLKTLQNKLKKIDGTNKDLAEIRNMLTCAELILKAAEKRKKSLGCHFVTA